ncbi:MAG: 50S ribosomal protein L9 [Rhodospirillaceae bacterium]|nr:50S ribosomal protein L9 [Rhodospirillaceae bacterium]MBT5458375.1 50S ribosomal protein L9 [Rhodospirillaceae bacterium]
MDVILLERIERLGQMGDVVTVKPGFARNYLLPQKKALRATEANKQVFETQRTQLETVNIEQRGEAESVAKKLDGLNFVIVRSASDNDQLYGSVTVRNIAQSITEEGFTVESKQVQLARPIKTVGMHDVIVRLHPEVSVTVKANVARTPEEAEMQAAGRRISRVDEDDDDVVETPFPSSYDPDAPDAEIEAAADEADASVVAESGTDSEETKPAE